MDSARVQAELGTCHRRLHVMLGLFSLSDRNMSAPSAHATVTLHRRPSLVHQHHLLARATRRRARRVRSSGVLRPRPHDQEKSRCARCTRNLAGAKRGPRPRSGAQPPEIRAAGRTATIIEFLMICTWRINLFLALHPLLRPCFRHSCETFS